MLKSRNLKIDFKKVLMFIILLAVSVTMIYPFLWTISSSFKTTQQLFSGSPLELIPNPAVPENYSDAWNYVPFGRFLLNSVFISTFVTAFQILLGSMAGYAFARLNFRGKNILFIAFLGTMMVPGHVTLIPNYVLMRYFSWIDKYQALMIPTFRYYLDS